jgi:modulator of FtsH protease HflK
MSWDDLHDPKNSDDRPKSGGTPPGKSPFEVPPINMPPFKPSMVVGIVVVLFLIWLVKGLFYFVEPDEEGVVTTFGKYSRTVQPGLHFKFPSPVEHVRTPKIRKVRAIEVGFRSSGRGPDQQAPAESLMLTGDQNIIDINLVVQYRIKDSVAFLFNVEEPFRLVKNTAETVIRGIIGSKKIDEALTTGKAEVQIIAAEQIQQLLNDYGSGVEVVTVQLQDVHPPDQVAAAFKDVVSAREDKERMINEAQGYRNSIIPEARGSAAQILRVAEAYREQTVRKAEGDSHRFLAQLKEYAYAPDITRKRIYLETMEEILPQAKKFVMSNKSGVLPILPLGANPLSGIGK